MLITNKAKINYYKNNKIKFIYKKYQCLNFKISNYKHKQITTNKIIN